MNFWGFTPFVFELLEEGFSVFRQANLNNPAAEFFITDVINAALRSKRDQNSCT